MIRINVLLIIPHLLILVFLLTFLYRLGHLRSDVYSRLGANTAGNEPSSGSGTESEQSDGDYYEAVESVEHRLLCWVLTSPKEHTTAIHVKRTWGSRCDILLFMSSKQDEQLGTILLPEVEEIHDKLWPKTQKAFEYVWEHHRNDADWFLKADVDTYVFTDNLRSFLRHFNSGKPYHFRSQADFYNANNALVNASGADYVLSKEALRLFIQDSLPHPEKCHKGVRPLYEADEDTELGACLQSVGVFPGHTFDDKGRFRFHVENPLNALAEVTKNYSKWNEAQSPSSDGPISFHYVKPEEFYVLEYLTQRLWHEENEIVLWKPSS